MPTLQITMPEPLKSYVDGQVSARGLSDASAYIQELILDAIDADARSAMESQLLEGVDALDRGDAHEMTADDWKRIREDYEVRVRARSA